MWMTGAAASEVTRGKGRIHTRAALMSENCGGKDRIASHRREGVCLLRRQKMRRILEMSVSMICAGVSIAGVSAVVTSGFG